MPRYTGTDARWEGFRRWLILRLTSIAVSHLLRAELWLDLRLMQRIVTVGCDPRHRSNVQRTGDEPCP